MRRFAFALLLVLPGCDDDVPAVTVRDQAGVVAEAACAGAFACDCGNAFTADYADEGACVDGITELLVDRALDDVGLSFNGECADRVAAALSSYACETGDEASASATLFAAGDQLRECRLFYGTAGAGESCERLDGGLGDSCDIAHFCADGACVAAGEGAFEDRCESDADCQQAFRCDMAEDMEMRCLEQPVAGDPCSMSGDCGAGAYCNSAGTCIALPGAGQACSASQSQDGLICAPGSACANGVCNAGALSGEPCGVTCAAGLACEGGFCVAADAAVCVYEVDAV